MYASGESGEMYVFLPTPPPPPSSGQTPFTQTHNQLTSNRHTKDYNCVHSRSPGALKDGKDDIGRCTAIYGPTAGATTKVTMSVTSMSASLANTTPVTVTGGMWVGPIETGESAKEGAAAGRSDHLPGMRMGGLLGGGDVGAVVVAVVVGGLVGVLGVVL